MAYLTQFSSSVPVIKFNIDQSFMTIGQDFEMDICVPEDGISDSHATVEAIKEAQSYRFIIKSNQDEPLLEFNGNSTTQVELKNNDWINIGGVEFQFTDDGVYEIKEIVNTSVEPLSVIDPIAKVVADTVVKPVATKTSKPIAQSIPKTVSEPILAAATLTDSEQPKAMTTKEYVAKSRYSRRRLAF